MHKMVKRLVLAVTAVSLGLAGLAAVAGPAEASLATATITQADPDSSCAGESATLVWTPADVTGLIGYQVVHQFYEARMPHFVTTEVGPDVTSLDFTIPFGLSTFLIRAVTSAGVQQEPFAAGHVRGNQAPFAMSWDNRENDAVGDGTATVSFKWYGPVTESIVGGVLPTTVRIVASPGGASVDIPTNGSWSVTHTFTGLTNGADYTFSAVTFNACGASGPSTSAVFTPGRAPVWTRGAPPLRTGPGEYVYNFTATGDPTPTYALVDAPSWLQISPRGRVSGRPPAGTDSFSYSVVAGNGVGIHPFDNTDVVAGPFTVSVWSP